MRAVEEHDPIRLAARRIAKARDERMLAAGNGHSGRIALWYD
jgi:hypothetical protein